MEAASETDLESRGPGPRYRGMCNACGSTLIPGWSCQVDREYAIHSVVRKRKDRRARRTAPAQSGISKTMVYHCLHCNSKIRQAVRNPSRSRALPRGSKAVIPPTSVRLSTEINSSSGHSASATPPPQTGGSTPPTVNAGSKKRAKARKQSGLQAMLAKSKTEAAATAGGGFGFDLMDFMKTS